MAGQDRMSSNDIDFLKSLEEAPYAADFLAVLRTVECIYASRPRLGESQRPSEDPIRMGQEVSMIFPPASLASFGQHKDDPKPKLLVYLFGLLGPNGPMPLHFTEHIYERGRRNNDHTLEAFLNLFHHRLISFFYRAWANAEPTVSMDRPATDEFGHFIASLIGLGLPALRNRDAMPDLAKLHYSGSLSCQNRHPDGLKSILSGFFDAPIEIEEFVGRWISLPKQCLCELGGNRRAARLGSNATVGYRVWDYQQTFRIILGPVSYDSFQRMLPGREGLKRLTDIVRNYLGDELAWELKLILKKDEVPRVSLGRQGSLGWTTWVQAGTPTQHADDLVLSRRPA